MTRRRSVGERPVGYPESYETSVRLADGRRVSVRPILPSDAGELAVAIRTADPETLYARFLGAPPRPTKSVLDRLTRLDYTNRFALVAHDREGRGVAVARYMAVARSAGLAPAAEVAIVVHPDWRSVGLATKLIRMLARRALECGITEFTATFLAQNRPVTELAHEGHARVAIKRGVAELHAQLTAASPGAGSDQSGAADERSSPSTFRAN